jgi:3D-(3,5/4)-trihydroxycyclohexane-1,2-dione acylhydrolase (decyclizing)
VQTDPLVDSPDSDAWWDVPIAEVAALATTRAACADYKQSKLAQRSYL